MALLTTAEDPRFVHVKMPEPLPQRAEVEESGRDYSAGYYQVFGVASSPAPWNWGKLANVGPAMDLDISQRPAWEFRLTGAVVAWMMPLSVVLFMLALAGYGAVHWSRLGPQPVPSGWAALVGLSAVLVAVIAVHEALHGIGFRAFGGRPRFGAGLASGMPVAFAFCPGHRFTRAQFLVIGALPLVGIDAFALALGAYAPLAPIGAVAIAINTAGAVGDLWMIALVLQAPRSAMFEDSDGRSIAAWVPPGTPVRRPLGLEPRGGKLAKLVLFAFAVLLVAFPLVSFAELALAQANGGTLRIAGVELVQVATRDGHRTARQNLAATLAVAAALSVILAGAAGPVRRRLRHSPS
jgi:hypothetical protein